jgi:hypothetical protein
LGIERVQADIFLWGEYRYSNLRERARRGKTRRKEMSRARFVSLDEADVVSKCAGRKRGHFGNRTAAQGWRPLGVHER